MNGGEEIRGPEALGEMQQQPQISMRTDAWWLIEIVTPAAKIRLKLKRGKVGQIEQTETIKV